ncbi:hypothetical protein KPL37_00890 [Clostridium frigoris]|uniref:Uncharacterized protein n=1 Tax=Clostridium frigoris TaxID=205327 RepID=A0ABS6BN30_9CLOT|nr:hypothetical protein [Clostridium frigoris]MBU3158329.1 hypothetical protein [Clostridium frigoris]
MTRTKGAKRNKLIGILIILVGILAVFAYMILYTGGATFKKTTSTGVIGKLAKVQVIGGEFELTQENMDELTTLYFAKPITKGNIILTGANVEILNDELLIEAPIKYKNLDLLFSSKGKVSVLNGKVTYDAQNFKIGKLRLPNKFVISQITKLDNKKLYVEANSIKVDPSMFPFEISSLKIKDNIIIAQAPKKSLKKSFQEITKMSGAEIDKQLDILKSKIQDAAALMTGEAEKAKLKEIQDIIDNSKGKSIEEKKQIISKGLNQINGAISNASDSTKKKELEGIRAQAEKAQKLAVEKAKVSQTQNATKSASLIKAKDDLSSAYSQAGTSKEKQMISMMQTSMGKMASNSSYNSSSDQASVKSIYSTMDTQSRNKFKYTLAANVDATNLSVLRQVFGI